MQQNQHNAFAYHMLALSLEAQRKYSMAGAMFKRALAVLHSNTRAGEAFNMQIHDLGQMIQAGIGRVTTSTKCDNMSGSDRLADAGLQAFNLSNTEDVANRGA